jgi:hypothetical protein
MTQETFGRYTFAEYAKPIGKTRYSFYTYENDEINDTLYFDSYDEAYSEWSCLSREEKDEVIHYVVQFETKVAPFAFEMGVIQPNTGKRIAKWREGKDI